MAYLPTTPLGVGPLLDSGFRLYAASLKHVFLLTGLASLINGLPGFWLNSQFPAQRVAPEAVYDLLGPAGAMMLLSMIASVLIYAVVVLRMQAIGAGAGPELGLELARGLKVLPWLILGSLLYMLAVAIGLVLFIVPGVILSISLVFYGYAIVLDRGGPVAGLKQSRRLVRGHWWRIALILSVAMIVGMTGYFAVALAVGFGAAFAGVGPQTMLLIDLLMQMVLGALVVPLFYAVLLAQYQDLKLRRQGDDLEARIEAGAADSSGLRA